MHFKYKTLACFEGSVEAQSSVFFYRTYVHNLVRWGGGQPLLIGLWIKFDMHYLAGHWTELHKKWVWNLVLRSLNRFAGRRQESSIEDDIFGGGTIQWQNTAGVVRRKESWQKALWMNYFMGNQYKTIWEIVQLNPSARVKKEMQWSMEDVR